MRSPHNIGSGKIRKIARASGPQVFQLDYRGPKGRRVRVLLRDPGGELCRTRSAAEIARARLISERDFAGVGGHGKPSERTLWSIALPMYLEGLAGRSGELYGQRAEAICRQILEETGCRTVGDIAMSRIDRWRIERAKSVAPRTVNRDVAHVRAFAQWLARQGYLPRSPLAGIGGMRERTTRPKRALTEAECRRLLEASRALDQELAETRGADRVSTTHTILALLLTGARWGAMRQVRWADVDLEAGVLTLRASTTKTRRTRTIPLATELASDLRALRVELARVLGGVPVASSEVWLSPAGKPWGEQPSNFRRFLSAALERAGIPAVDEEGASITPHSFRHTFVTRLLRAGVPLETVRRLSGHASIQLMVATYGHLMVEDTRKAVETLPVLEAAVERLCHHSGTTTQPDSPTRRRKSL